MTVGELIEALKKYPAENQIVTMTGPEVGGYQGFVYVEPFEVRERQSRNWPEYLGRIYVGGI